MPPVSRSSPELNWLCNFGSLKAQRHIHFWKPLINSTFWGDPFPKWGPSLWHPKSPFGVSPSLPFRGNIIYWWSLIRWPQWECKWKVPRLRPGSDYIPLTFDSLSRHCVLAPLKFFRSISDGPSKNLNLPSPWSRSFNLKGLYHINFIEVFRGCSDWF